MDNCIFCKIIAGEIPAEVVYENEHVVAFRDLSPQAPTPVLVIPRRHISTLNDLEQDDAETVGQMVLAAAEMTNFAFVRSSPSRSTVAMTWEAVTVTS